MIHLRQLAIPNYQPLRKVEAEALRRDGFTVLRKHNLIPDRVENTDTGSLLDDMIHYLCDLLEDDTCANASSFNSNVEDLTDFVISLLTKHSLVSANDLQLLDCKIRMRNVETLRDAVESVLTCRVIDMLECLMDHYGEVLHADLERLNEYNLFIQRTELRKSIVNELDDAFESRAQMNADEAAMWLLTNTVGAQVDVALASLKDGQNLVDAVAAAKTLHPSLSTAAELEPR